MPWTKVAVEEADGKRPAVAEDDRERLLSYGEAIREATFQALSRDKRVFLLGEGVDDPSGIFGSTLGLHKEFGSRVSDTPIAENALTGFCVGAALSGMRPILVHMRMDFMPLSFDQILNHAAKLRYMSGGKVSVPFVIRCIIGKGWGSAAQHSQSLHGFFMHMPGIKVVMPSCAYDAKGLLLAGIADDNPVVYIEHRWLYGRKDHVPQQEYLIPIGRGLRRRQGKDVTVVALSLMCDEALSAAEKLAQEQIDVEVIDPRSLNPFDEDLLVESVAKTGRLVIADLGWRGGGAAEIILGRIYNKIRTYLKADVSVVALADVPAPSSSVLEDAYYKGWHDILEGVKKVL